MVVGDGGCEAYTTILWGALLSSEIAKLAEAETVSNVEGNMCGTAMRGADALPESKTASRRKGSRWNLGDLRSGRHARSASGRRGAVADDARAGEVGQARSTAEVLEQGRAIGGGEDGGKAPGRGETGSVTHAPGTGPDRRDTAAGTVLLRNCMGPSTPNGATVSPETGARCGKAARRDLRGGLVATPVPTATVASGASQ